MKTPLWLLAKEECFAVNKIHLIYPRTAWRPTYYVKVDYNAVDKLTWKWEIAANLHVKKMWLWDAMQHGHPVDHANHDDMPDGVGDVHDNIVWVPRCEHIYAAGNVKAVKEWHLPEICTAFNSISIMAQCAVLEGFEELYLVGCDIIGDHFDPGYGAVWGDGARLAMLAGHELIKKSCPVPVYNATVGGALDMYPRKTIEDVIYAKG